MSGKRHGTTAVRREHGSPRPDRRRGPLERRRDTRVAAAVRVTFESAHDFYAGTSDDMSYGGVFIATAAPPPPGTALRLTIKLPGGARVDADGMVRWVRPPELAEAGRPAGCGVAWTALDAKATRAVRRFVDELHASATSAAAASPLAPAPTAAF